MEKRIFQFDEASLNSSSSSGSSYLNYTTTESTIFSTTTTTTTENDLQPHATEGIFEDHPGLNPHDERVVELQSDIREKLEDLTGDPERALVAAEVLHGESNNIPFMEGILDDLSQGGVNSQAYRDALDLAGMVPSPLEQFEITPLIPMNIGDFYFSFTNPSLSMLLTLSFVLLLVHFVTKNGGGNSVPN
ncbi:Atp synthase subunit a, partial [Thalictrum thalictroides]